MLHIIKKSAINLSKFYHGNRKEDITSETNLDVDSASSDLYYLLRYHVLVKKKVYSLAQVRKMYDEL